MKSLHSGELSVPFTCQGMGGHLSLGLEPELSRDFSLDSECSTIYFMIPSLSESPFHLNLIIYGAGITAGASALQDNAESKYI